MLLASLGAQSKVHNDSMRTVSFFYSQQYLLQLGQGLSYENILGNKTKAFMILLLYGLLHFQIFPIA